MRRQLTTVRELRRTNRSLALWELYLRGTLSRQQIGEGAGFSLATVSNVIGELIDEGLVTEVGLQDSNGGRPRTLVRINPAFGHVIGVDIGETALLVELFDLGMNVLASHRSPIVLTGLDAQQAVAQVADAISLVLRDAGIGTTADAGAPGGVLGVGVGAPGLVEHRVDGAVVHGQSVGWHEVPVERLLRERVHLPVVLDNGAMALGQAEAWFGAARGVDNAVVALLGIGVGTGIVANRTLYRSATSSAGEWGHTTIVVDGRRCRCGARGCLEAYVGGAALVARYDELTGAARTGGPPDLEERVNDIIAGIESDPVARQVLDETATYLGVGIANLANLIDPNRIIVGGWLGLAVADALLPKVRTVAGQNALRFPAGHLHIVGAELGPDAVALGAATLPVAAFLNAGGAAPDRPGIRRAQTRRPTRSAETRRRGRAPDR